MGPCCVVAVGLSAVDHHVQHIEAADQALDRLAVAHIQWAQSQPGHRPLLPGHVTFGPRAGQEVLTLQRAMPRETGFERALCADSEGFSPHAAVRCGANERRVWNNRAATSPAGC